MDSHYQTVDLRVVVGVIRTRALDADRVFVVLGLLSL